MAEKLAATFIDEYKSREWRSSKLREKAEELRGGEIAAESRERRAESPEGNLSPGPSPGKGGEVVGARPWWLYDRDGE